MKNKVDKGSLWPRLIYDSRDKTMWLPSRNEIIPYEYDESALTFTCNSSELKKMGIISFSTIFELTDSIDNSYLLFRLEDKIRTDNKIECWHYKSEEGFHFKILA